MENYTLFTRKKECLRTAYGKVAWEHVFLFDSNLWDMLQDSTKRKGETCKVWHFFSVHYAEVGDDSEEDQDLAGAIYFLRRTAAPFLLL